MRSEVRMLILLCLLALPAGGVHAVAQEKQPETETKRADEADRLKARRVESERLKEQRAAEARATKARRVEEAAQRSAKRAITADLERTKRAIETSRRAAEVSRRAILPAGTFKLLDSRINLNKLVKGAPYSATAVTEFTQTLSDGNQIIRRNEVACYRDSEGRTRMEQTLKQIGNWVAVGAPQRIVMIADPVAGYYYSLDLNGLKAMKSPLANKFPSPESLREETEKQKASWDRLRQEFEGQRTRERQMFEERWDSRRRALEDQRGRSGQVQDDELAKQKRIFEEQRVKSKQAFAEQAAQRKQRFEQQMLERKQRFDEQLKRRQGLDRSLPREISEKALSRTIESSLSKSLSKSTDSSSSESKPKTTVSEAQSDNRKKTEALGKRVVESVEAEGIRTTVTIPAGEIGNTLPIQVVDETWFSRELQVPVMTRHHDPRAGDNVFRLTKINRAEPARPLFEVPAGYTIVENSRPKFPTAPREPKVGPKPPSGNLPKPPTGALEPAKPVPSKDERSW
jgi:hypothetical protein